MKSLFSIFMLFSSMAFAHSGVEAKARFDVWLQVIEKALSISPDSQVVAEELLEEENRIAAFHLQALGKVYEPQKSEFSRVIRKNFKDLEDAMGEYDKWKKIAKKSGSSKDKERAHQAKKEFAQLLEERHWLPLGKKDRLSEIKNFLNDFKWESPKEDKEQVLKVLTQQLEKLNQTKYDLSRLEKDDGDGNGLHEFRREIRWFLIEARALNGLLIFREGKSCSVPELKALLENAELVNSRYSALPRTALEKDPCAIEQCLFLGLADAVTQLGQMKDAAEQDKAARDSDRVRSDDLPKAQALADLLKRTQIFSGLSKNIHSCRQ